MNCTCVRASGVALLLLLLATPTVQGQTLLSETTWGGVGSDIADGVAVAPDGSSYVVGISDSFANDQFGNPSPRIFVVKFAADGSLVWQRIWNELTIRGLGRPGVAVTSDGNSVYVTGIGAVNGNDAVLLKFDAVTGALLWERTWGGAENDVAFDVATAADGSAYVVGTATSFGPSSSGLFVVKFNPTGTLVWQRLADGAAGNAVAVGPDGSVFAAGTTPRPDQIGNFDIVALKITATGSQVWQRTYSAGEVVDPRGRMAAGPDGSIVLAGAIQAPKAGIVDLAALLVKLTGDGNLVFDKEFGGRGGEDAQGVAVAANDGSIYFAGTTTSFGAGDQDAFVVHLQASGKKVLDAATWGGTGFETGAGVGVSNSAVSLAATTTQPPPYSLLGLAAKLSAPRGTLSIATQTLGPVLGVVGDPGAGVTPTAGSTIFSGNFEAALVRIAR